MLHDIYSEGVSEQKYNKEKLPTFFSQTSLCILPSKSLVVHAEPHPHSIYPWQIEHEWSILDRQAGIDGAEPAWWPTVMLHQLSECLVVVVQVLDRPIPIIIHCFKAFVARLQSPGMSELEADPLKRGMPLARPQSAGGDLWVYQRGRESCHCCEQQSFFEYLSHGFEG